MFIDSLLSHNPQGSPTHSQSSPARHKSENSRGISPRIGDSPPRPTGSPRLAFDPSATRGVLAYPSTDTAVHKKSCTMRCQPHSKALLTDAKP